MHCGAGCRTGSSWNCLLRSTRRYWDPGSIRTFDDPASEGSADLNWQELNDRILYALAKHKAKSVLFVCGKRVDSPAGRKLIAMWDRAGHGIGNHSYSHLYFNASTGNHQVTLAEF